MKKICIVEDDLGISASLKLYLENSDFQVITHDSGGGACELILSEKPDLVILDINLPEKDGVEVCKELRITSQIHIIMLTAKSGEMDRITGLESGADDYIAKPFSPRELLARIHSVLRRRNIDNEKKFDTLLEYDNIVLNIKKREVFVSEKNVALTKNEYDILECIMREDGELVSRESLMTDIIGYDNYVYDRTIDTHIKNLRKKLENKDMILTIRGKGYRLNK